MACLRVVGVPKWDFYYALVNAMDTHRISSAPMMQLNKWIYSNNGYVDISTFSFTQNDLERLKHSDFDFYREYIKAEKN